jgi:hypothetical protein
MKIIFIIFIYLFSFGNGCDVDLFKIIGTNKSKWGVEDVIVEKQHYFDLKINNCFKGLIKDTLGKPQTFLLKKNKLYVCVIEEIKFKNNKLCDSIYYVLNREAENVRTRPRNKFKDVCFELREAQFYYVVKKDNAIYLFSDGDSYNYKYNTGNDSNDAIISRDQKAKNEIIFDDIYRFVKKY